MKIIIGSSALQYHGVELSRTKFNKNSDVDYFITKDTMSSYDKEYNDDLIILPEEIMDMVEHTNGYATPSSVLTIKMSHLNWNVNWDKHSRDVYWLLRHGYKPNQLLLEALKIHWNNIYSNDCKKLSLMQTKDEFFNNSFKYMIDHDHLHRLVSPTYTPIYTKCLMDGQEVMIDYEKFKALSAFEKVQMFHEEITTLAIERWIIPSHGTISWQIAHLKAYKLVVTKLTKNWANDFVINNIDLLSIPDHDLYSIALIRLEMWKKYSKDTMEEYDEYTKIDNHMISYDMFNVALALPYDLHSLLLGEYGAPYPERLREFKYSKDHEVMLHDVTMCGAVDHHHIVYKLGEKLYSIEFNVIIDSRIQVLGSSQTLKQVKPVERKVISYE